MSKTLRLYQPVKLRGEIGFLDKGDHKNINPVIIKHWLIKAMIKDGHAIVIDEMDEPTDSGKTAAKKGRAPKAPAPKQESAVPPADSGSASGEDKPEGETNDTNEENCDTGGE